MPDLRDGPGTAQGRRRTTRRSGAARACARRREPVGLRLRRAHDPLLPQSDGPDHHLAGTAQGRNGNGLRPGVRRRGRVGVNQRGHGHHRPGGATEHERDHREGRAAGRVAPDPHRRLPRLRPREDGLGHHQVPGLHREGIRQLRGAASPQGRAPVRRVRPGAGPDRAGAAVGGQLRRADEGRAGGRPATGSSPPRRGPHPPLLLGHRRRPDRPHAGKRSRLPHPCRRGAFLGRRHEADGRPRRHGHPSRHGAHPHRGHVHPVAHRGGLRGSAPLGARGQPRRRQADLLPWPVVHRSSSLHRAGGVGEDPDHSAHPRDPEPRRPPARRDVRHRHVLAGRSGERHRGALQCGDPHRGTQRRHSRPRQRPLRATRRRARPLGRGLGAGVVRALRG